LVCGVNTIEACPVEKQAGTILIVDDTLDNLDLLSRLLTRKGYKVLTAINGIEALDIIPVALPDLILLDICMPEMDGYTLCRRLKADPDLSNIPVIFLSALDETSAKLKAFETGGIDYITKPFQMEEVLARVTTHLSLQRLQQQLRLQNLQLQDQITARRYAEQRYRSIFENSVLGMFQATPDGHFLKANAALARIYGYASPDELINSMTNIGRQLYVRPGRRQELMAYLRQFEQVSDFESQIYQKDGTIIWISESIRTAEDDTGALLCFEGIVEDITERKQTEVELWRQRRKAEQLLLNIFPQKIAEKLKRQQGMIADNYDDVTVLFADVVNFTALSSRVSAKELVDLLSRIFKAFDQLAEQYGVEKIKTIGDGYMMAAGVPGRRTDHASALAKVALAMQESISQFWLVLGEPCQLRIGLSTGSVIAGVIEGKRSSFDLWGETVNLASRMQTCCPVGGIQVTESTYQALKEEYDFAARGVIPVKGVGERLTYLLIGEKTNRLNLTE